MAVPRAAGEPKPAADAYLLSYPKTGRTWLRALVGRALVRHYRLPEARLLETDVLTRMAGLPVAAFYHDGSAMLDGHTWRDLPADKSAYAGKRVLLLGRDVRDTLVSAYFQATRRIGVYTGPIADFVRDERYGADKVLAFYRHWDLARYVPRAFAFLRYEAMHADPAAALARTLEFLGARDVAEATIAEAIGYARFDNLRRVEAEGFFGDPALRAGVAADPESYKVRRGKVGGFRDYLSDGDIAWIDARVAEAGCEFTRPD